MLVTDILPQKVLGLNRQNYKQLKLALSLGLRRQIFLAVCDDLRLRNRLAARLEIELADFPETSDRDGLSKEFAAQSYPRLVTLELNIREPSPIAQIGEWLAEHPPPVPGIKLPVFQILGVEKLTRSAAAVQWFFLNELREIELRLVETGVPRIGECSLLLWIPRPWCHTIATESPEFWGCRTGVFEFEGEPTPASEERDTHYAIAVDDSVGDRVRSPRDPSQKTPVMPVSRLFEEKENVETTQPRRQEQTNPREKVVETGLVPSGVGEEKNHPPPTLLPLNAEEKPPSDPTSVTAKPSEGKAAHNRLKVDNPAIASAPIPVAKQIPTQPQKISAGLPQTAPPRLVELVFATVRAPENVNTPTLASFDSVPIQLLQQIEQLHRQQAPQTDVASAYLTLGNFYRDLLNRNAGTQKGASAASGNASSASSPQHLKIAILSYEQVLQFLDRDASGWTDLANDLGNFYWMLSRYGSSVEEKLSNLEQAIQAYQKGLVNVNSGVSQARVWGMIHNNLGAVYSDLARYKDRVENLQHSIESYKEALRYRKVELEAEPNGNARAYAATQNNLGTGYWNLAQHSDPANNLKRAIAAYTEALGYYAPEQQPLDYAMIQNNIGTAYWNLAQYENPRDYLRLAIGAYQIALQYRTPSVIPAACAATQNNLGTAYWHLANQSKGEPAVRAEFLQQAIAAYESALKTADLLRQNERETQSQSSTPTPLAFDIFAAHNNLGLAYSQLVTETAALRDPIARSNHLEASLHHHLQALQGWQNQTEFYNTALSYVVQTIRAFYKELGIQGQNFALSKIPGQLLPHIISRL